MTCLVRIGGGFGNQLFQFALGRHLALSRGIAVVYETGFYEDRSTQGLAHHTLWLDKIGLDIETRALAQLRFHILRRLHRLPPGVQRTLVGLSILRERGARMVLPDPLDNVLVNGVWTDPWYFEGSQDRIRAEILDAIGGPLDPGGSGHGVSRVGVHVRRGDFLSHGYFVTLDYPAVLANARAILDSRLGRGSYEFVVFSDDTAWCRANLAADDVRFGSGRSMLDDFRMMIACDHNVISNSTFSWWAAYLAAEPGRVVIAPERWFTRAETPAGLLRPNWDVIDD